MVIVTGKYPQAQLVGLQGLRSLGLPPGMTMSQGATANATGINRNTASAYGAVFDATQGGGTGAAYDALQAAAKAGGTGTGCTTGTTQPCTMADGSSGTQTCAGGVFSACAKKTNWLLYGGIALAAVVAWKVLR